ncbi:hypothetical protein DQ04_00201210 [Trypanosoma grayi]|uniref:hypothetical protein n=1 Tax=Trypanosoma grayi TaxID=71804 RepID=UPI0004F40440|nr:hypothetical protein DQ04_00201210 [Trypanosoma grayi]KEG15068.1 hypothetical protein DQ04_00201210 [Trypanosoma grayi]
MRSAFEIARSHIALPLSQDTGTLRRVLRDWVHYAERLQLQEKPTCPAALCITVHPSRGCTRRQQKQQQERQHSYHQHQHKSLSAVTGKAASVYTKHIPLQLWTALLPWEVQRGLSCSELRLPNAHSTAAVEAAAHVEKNEVTGDGEEDPLGVVTAPSTSGSGVGLHKPAAPSPAAAAAPGMLFVMDADAVAQGIGFWSGAIQQPIDVAFITPVEPAAVDAPSFQQLRQCRLAAADGSSENDGYSPARFFPDGELDSPTVTFAVQSYAHLDPFPHCDRSAGEGAGGGARQHTAEPETATPATSKTPDGQVARDTVPRYVLETTRYLLRDSIANALCEFHQLHQVASGRKTQDTASDNVELTITLVLSDALKEELREKARLYTNYVLPLEEHIRHHIRRLNTSVSDALTDDGVGEQTEKTKDNLVVHAAAPAAGIIRPSQAGVTRADRNLSRRSPMLADEDEGRPSCLVPSVLGKHEAPALQRAQQQQGQFVSARALARIPNTASRMPSVQPIDYELFDLCLRLGLCQKDAIYYFYGRIMREWQKELQRLQRSTASGGGGGGGDRGINSAGIGEADVGRMLLLVRDPSLQVPAELVACVEAVAQRRGIAIREGSP